MGVILTGATRTVVCDGCGAVIVAEEPRYKRKRRGRPVRWCSNACRMRTARREEGSP